MTLSFLSACKGCVRVVHYTADSKGFHPKVTYEGPDCHRHLQSGSSTTVVKPVLDFAPGLLDSLSTNSNKDKIGLVIPRPQQASSSTSSLMDRSLFDETARPSEDESISFEREATGHQSLFKDTPSPVSQQRQTLVQVRRPLNNDNRFNAGTTGRDSSSETFITESGKFSFDRETTSLNQEEIINDPGILDFLPQKITSSVQNVVIKPVSNLVQSFTNKKPENAAPPSPTVAAQEDSSSRVDSVIVNSKGSVPSSILTLLKSFDEDPVLPEASEMAISRVPPPTELEASTGSNSEKFIRPSTLNQILLPQSFSNLVSTPIATLLENLNILPDSSERGEELLEPRDETYEPTTLPAFLEEISASSSSIEQEVPTTTPESKLIITEPTALKETDYILSAGTEQSVSPYEDKHPTLSVQPIPGTIYMNTGSSSVMEPLDQHPQFIFQQQPSSKIMRAYVPAYHFMLPNQQQSAVTPYEIRPPTTVLPAPKPTWSPYYSAYVYHP